jgi:cell division transport system permease protein
MTVPLFYFREAWRSFRHHRGLATTAILALTAALTVAAVFVLLAQNARMTMRLVGDRREMVVYLKDETTREQRDAMVDRLQQLYGEVTYVNKEQAWQEFSDQVGDPELLEAVDGNPLPASLRIKLKPELLNYTAMESTAKQLQQFPEVEDVRFGGDWVKRLDTVSRAIQEGAIIVGMIVALAMMFVLHNTIRLSVLARRPQVEIMSRLGATDRFIATPFVIEALIQAAIAAVLALLAVLAFQRAFVARVVPIAFLPWTWIAAFFVAVVAIAWVTAMLALNRVLRTVGP